MTALKDLLAKVEAGTIFAGDYVTDEESALVYAVFPPNDDDVVSMAEWVGLAYEGSLDAAKALHEAVLPGWDLQICTYEDDLFEVSVSPPLCVKTYDGLSEIIARAWLIAILRALIAQEGA